MDAELPNWRQSYYAENYARLKVVKAKYDPYRYFKFAQGIGA
ncbi:BBE domain-containing protein [Streptomyces mirabilis]|nr:BBE domain-containing protein [Streptomyces mirabilis]